MASKMHEVVAFGTPTLSYPPITIAMVRNIAHQIVRLLAWIVVLTVLVGGIAFLVWLYGGDSSGFTPGLPGSSSAIVLLEQGG